MVTLVVIIFLLMITSEAQAAFKMAVVRADSVNVRSGPGTGNLKAGTVNKGDKLFVIKQSGDWQQVILFNGKSGWITKKYLAVLNKGVRFTVKPAAPASPVAAPGNGQTAVVIAENVNVRSGPGTTYQIVAVANKATRITVLNQNNGWSNIQLPDATKGWMATRFVDMRTDISRGGDTNQPPASQPPASQPPTAPVPANPAEPVAPQPANPPTIAPDPSQPLPGEIPTMPDQPLPAPKLLKMEATQLDAVNEVLVLTGETPINYTFTKLKNPDRLVIDIKNMDKSDVSDLLTDSFSYMSQVRVSQFSLSPMTVRIVVDLKRIPSYKAALSADNLSLTVSLTEPTIRGKTVMLDAGHGAHDPGAVGVTGLQEKVVNLDIAWRVQKLLADMGANVMMTRSDDTFIPLVQRAALANTANADIFVAIHTNSSTSSSQNGTSTYYYAPAANPALYTQLDQRLSMASKVQSQLAQSLGIRNIGTLQGNFAVLRETRMPSILVETAFLSNKSEEALLKTEDFRDKAAQAIARGLADYFANPV